MKTLSLAPIHNASAPTPAAERLPGYDRKSRRLELVVFLILGKIALAAIALAVFGPIKLAAAKERLVAALSSGPVAGAIGGAGTLSLTDAKTGDHASGAEADGLSAACPNCRDTWDWGPAYWRWGYSAGAWEIPSHEKWPNTPYFRPVLKHRCPACSNPNGSRPERYNRGKQATSA